MPCPTEIQNIIEESVEEVFARALPGLRAEIVRPATAELESLSPAPGASPTDRLSAAAASIIRGWPGTGFQNNEVQST